MKKYEKGNILMFLLIGINIMLFLSILNNTPANIIIDPLDNKGNVEVAIQDQFSNSVSLFFSELIAPINITVNTSIDDTVIRISSNVIPVAGNYVCFKEENAFYQDEILNVASVGGNIYDITVSTPLDYAFTTNGGCSIRNINMAVDGSVTPHYFTISPSSTTQDWDIYTIGYHMEDLTDMDSERFGGITGGLTNGLVGRLVDGTTKNLFNIKSNGDFVHYGFSTIYNLRAPAGVYSLQGEKNYHDKHGVSLRVKNETNDTLMVIVQDDLTPLEELHINVLGHVVE